jgi:hypothetical protein
MDVTPWVVRMTLAQIQGILSEDPDICLWLQDEDDRDDTSDNADTP